MISSGSSHLLKLLSQPIVEVIPQGWKTVAQWSKETGLSESQTGKLLKKATQEGLFERRLFRVGRPIPHYKKKA